MSVNKVACIFRLVLQLIQQLCTVQLQRSNNSKDIGLAVWLMRDLNSGPFSSFSQNVLGNRKIQELPVEKRCKNLLSSFNQSQMLGQKFGKKRQTQPLVRSFSRSLFLFLSVWLAVEIPVSSVNAKDGEHALFHLACEPWLFSTLVLADTIDFDLWASKIFCYPQKDPSPLEHCFLCMR